MQDNIKKLQSEIKNLNHTIDNLNKKLKDSESMKSNFISNIMNEIYNPFSSILSLSQTIISLDKDSISKAIPIAETIYEEAATLDFDLKNIFSAARIEAGLEIPLIKKGKFFELLNDVIESCQLLALKRNIRIDIIKETEIENTEIHADFEFLQQIIINILNNAIKFSQDNSTVKINYSISETNIQIKISDTGKGISSADKQQIFNRFKKLNTAVNSINSGYGLGLAIALALLDIINGKIEIIDNNPTGCIVTVDIPQSEIIDNKENDSDIFFDADEEIF